MRLDLVPQTAREGLEALAARLTTCAGERLLALCAFGGWLSDDALYKGTPARSVAVLRDFDLRLVDALAADGPRLGRLGIAAPLLMTPVYIAASADTFPLELLEIRQTRVCLLGGDPFGDLKFASADVRLQCERELKSALLQIRQGLLTAAGRREPLAELCRAEAERCVRVLRGRLYLAGEAATGPTPDIVHRAAELTGLPLAGVRDVVAGRPVLDLPGLTIFHDDVAALAAHLDTFSPPGGR